MHKPDNWVIIKIDDVTCGTVYKVLGGWSGGYLHGDSWRMNSGIVSVEFDGEYYYFMGWSGSIYKCHKDSETIRMNIAGVFESIIKHDKAKHVSLATMLKDKNVKYKEITKEIE